MEQNNSLTFTSAAANKVLQLITVENNPSLRLRIYIQGGGCAGFEYGFRFDEAQNADDLVIEQNGAALIVDAMSLQYLVGATIDYIDNLKGAHFVVSNPNANTTCGCGSSFSV
jgi:iron-sulfur cluster insertion protein